MAHRHTTADNDLYFTIDAESRSISFLGETQPIISNMDHNSEHFTFELPRYIEGHDMLLCDVIQVHYINISSDNSISRNTGIYKVTDLQLDPEDDTESTLLCSWLISQNATLLAGSLSFALRFVCTSGDKIDYAWSTGPYSGVTVTQTIDNSNMIVEQYTDIIQSWYNELIMAGTMGVNVVVEAQNNALEEIATAKQKAIDDLSDGAVAQEAMANIRATEAIVMEREREELITEILERIVLTDTNYYTKAEGVSV